MSAKEFLQSNFAKRINTNEIKRLSITINKALEIGGNTSSVFNAAAKEKNLYGQNRIAEGKVPLCASMCATKALMAGDADVVADVYRERVFKRGSGANAWGWDKAYKK